MHGHTKRIGNRTRHAGRNPGRIAILRAARHQQEISHIDTGAQNAGWRQFGLDLIHHAIFPFDYCISAARRGGRTSTAIDMPPAPAIKDRTRHEARLLRTEEHYTRCEIRRRAKRTE